ncbi:MAG: ABC transporter ATP-binding protein [Clostridia bacterium]|nr:ABC transporter ATP-binding protein [Clostridia bacterium]
MAGLMPIITLFFYGLICVIVAKSINSVSTLDIVKDRQTIVDTIPNLTAFIAYFSLILTSILSVVSIIVSIPRAVISGKRIKEIMVAVSDIQPPENPIEPKAGDIGKVEFRDVSFKYKPRPAGKKKRRAPAPKKRPVKTDKKPEAIAAAPGAAPDDAGIAADGARTEIPVPAEKAAKAPAEEKKKEKVFELKHVSFVSNPGEVTAIIGVTGSGKTTLMNLIPRLYDCTEGEVLVNGVNVKDLAPQTLADAIAVVPQQAFLFSGTVADNIRYGNQDATETDIWRALEIAQAKSFVAAMPDGIDSFVSQAGKNYSGGQKQRLAIARAIVKRAPIILFDDSFSALDLATDARLRASLKENLTDTNLIIVAQRVGTVLNADRIIVLEDGNVMGVGTHRELLENCDVYREIVVTQLSEDALSELPGGAADNSGKEDADDGENEE